MNFKKHNASFCIHCTLPVERCLCANAPKLILPSQVHILYHPKEFQRRNSSGRLLSHCFNINSSPWHRLKNVQYSKTFKDYALLYPNTEKECSKFTHTSKSNSKTGPFTHMGSVKGFIWLDATWQESRKILRQSPWLNNLPKYSITATPDFTSHGYELRRNQIKTGLSTIETFAYWLYEQNQTQSAQDLLNFFNQFQSEYLAVRDAGLFK